MNVRTIASRPTRALTRTAVVAVALAALGTAGTVGAAAATPGTAPAAAPSGAASAPPGAVVVKEVRTADGVLTVSRLDDASVAGGVFRPDSGSYCSGANPRVCFSVNGSGYYVSSMYNTTTYGSDAWADMQIKNPSGGIVARASFAAGAGTYTVSYKPYAYVAGGWWCGYSNANGGVYTGSCVTVTN
ncbi:hypothetical protein ACFV0O_35180 [Kitasatospora sp. NPDC059577]|uniref:hypothetical protein n=1 Tax=Kitasatospora sp. NPDC059577 TaxID=3346873 RepID=UPI0036BFAB73